MGAILLYNCDNRLSYDSVVMYWLSAVRNHAGPNVGIMLVGNVCAPHLRVVPVEEAKEFAGDCFKSQWVYADSLQQV